MNSDKVSRSGQGISSIIAIAWFGLICKHTDGLSGNFYPCSSAKRQCSTSVSSLLDPLTQGDHILFSSKYNTWPGPETLWGLGQDVLI